MATQRGSPRGVGVELPPITTFQVLPQLLLTAHSPWAISYLCLWSPPSPNQSQASTSRPYFSSKFQAHVSKYLLEIYQMLCSYQQLSPSLNQNDPSLIFFPLGQWETSLSAQLPKLQLGAQELSLSLTTHIQTNMFIFLFLFLVRDPLQDRVSFSLLICY